MYKIILPLLIYLSVSKQGLLNTQLYSLVHIHMVLDFFSFLTSKGY